MLRTFALLATDFMMTIPLQAADFFGPQDRPQVRAGGMAESSLSPHRDLALQGFSNRPLGRTRQ
jgi:hypothetical protein